MQNGKEFVDKDGKIKLEITNDITLYAKWINKEYSFIFNANGGALDNNSYKYTYDEVINSFPIPTLEGYDFIGWKDTNGSIISDANGIPLADNKLFTNKSYNINNDPIIVI